MIEDEIAENQGRTLLYKQINHDDWNEFDPAVSNKSKAINN